MSSSLEIRRNHLGSGVYSTHGAAAGSEVLTFRGYEVSGDEAVESPHTLQISDDLYIDVVAPGRYVNHSCAPNCGITDNNVLVALRDLEPGEEITFDYSTTMFTGNKWVMDCQCGGPNCRGTIEDFDHLPVRIQRRYIDLGILSGHVARRMGIVPRKKWSADRKVTPELVTAAAH